MFNNLPYEYKKIQDDCDKLFEFYGGCNNCNHQLCCKITSPVILWGEIIPIAKKIKMKPVEFEKKYLFDIGDAQFPIEINRYILKKMPCPFYKDERCTIHLVRPLACIVYPLEFGIDLIRLHGIGVCPIATLIADEIKEFIKKSNIKLKFLKENEKNGKEFYEKVVGSNNLVHKAYEKLGLTDIVEQEYFDLYPKNVFLKFIKNKLRN